MKAIKNGCLAGLISQIGSKNCRLARQSSAKILTLFVLGVRQCVEERSHDGEGDEVDDDLLPAALLRKAHVDRILVALVVVVTVGLKFEEPRVGFDFYLSTTVTYLLIIDNL